MCGYLGDWRSRAFLRHPTTLKHPWENRPKPCILSCAEANQNSKCNFLLRRRKYQQSPLDNTTAAPALLLCAYTEPHPTECIVSKLLVYRPASDVRETRVRPQRCVCRNSLVVGVLREGSLPTCFEQKATKRAFEYIHAMALGPRLQS